MRLTTKLFLLLLLFSGLVTRGVDWSIEQIQGPPEYPTPAWVNLLQNAAYFLCFISAVACVAGLIWLRLGRASMKRRMGIGITLVLVLFADFCVSSELLRSGGPPYHRRLQNDAWRLSTSARQYAREHHNHYPPSLSVLVSEIPLIAGRIDPHWNRSRSSTTQPEAWARYVNQVEAKSLFIYTAGDLTDSPTLNPNIIVAYSRPLERLPGRRIVVFANDAARVVPDSRLKALFAACNIARSDLHLPPLLLDRIPTTTTRN